LSSLRSSFCSRGTRRLARLASSRNLFSQEYTVTVRDAAFLMTLVADQIWRIAEREPETFWAISAVGHSIQNTCNKGMNMML
jgi:hypothetical protein